VSASSIVDPNGAPPLVNSLEVDPSTGELLVTTNRGFFRVDPHSGRPARVQSVATARGRSVPVGNYLDVLPVGPHELLGSGHPDVSGRLPQYLGVLRSEDGGRTWGGGPVLGSARDPQPAREPAVRAHDAPLPALHR
jgi:hypothetical protein